MKAQPEFLLNKNQKIAFKKILIAGSDESFISFLTQFVVESFVKKNYFIDRSGNIKVNLVGDLFSKKKVLFLLKNVLIKKNLFEKVDFNNSSVLISSSNNKTINSLKAEFAKSKDSLVIDCYPLDVSRKEVVIRGFVEKENIEISQNVYWYVVEKFDNNYVALINQLQLLCLFNKKINSVKEVERVVFVDDKVELNKIFFYIYKNNAFLLNIFEKNIYSQADLYIFLNSLKLYLSIIGNSSNSSEALKKFPKYLFSEKDVFVKIYNNLNKNKISQIYKNIFKLESLTRTNSGLYFEIGQRFFLNLKKIITS